MRKILIVMIKIVLSLKFMMIKTQINKGKNNKLLKKMMIKMNSMIKNRN